jgi:hypothetical protein
VFTAKQIELAQRKARLLERIDIQRGQIAVHAEALKIPFGLADKALQAVRYVQMHPWTAGVAMFAAVVLGRRNLWRWAGRGWTLWRGWRFARRWLSQQGFKKI